MSVFKPGAACDEERSHRRQLIVLAVAAAFWRGARCESCSGSDVLTFISQREHRRDAWIAEIVESLGHFTFPVNRHVRDSAQTGDQRFIVNVQRLGTEQ